MKLTQSGKLAIALMLLTTAIAVTGVGFGLWSQILSVNGEVQTGNVLVEYGDYHGLGAFTDDDGIVDDLVYGPAIFLEPLDAGEEDPNGSGSIPAIQIYDGNGSSSSADPSSSGPFMSRYDKDVGICTADTAPDLQGNETILEIIISNGYPSYWCTTWFPTKNTGSVPVKLQSKTLISVSPEVDLAFGIGYCVDTDGFSPPLPLLEPPPEATNYCPEVDGILTTSSPEDYDIFIAMCPAIAPDAIGIGTQLDPTPSEFDSGLSCITMHVEQGFEQGDEETFQIELLWVQWNEYVEPEFEFPPIPEP